MKKILTAFLLLFGLVAPTYSADYKPVKGEIDNWQNHGYNTDGYIIRLVNGEVDKNPRVEILSPAGKMLLSLSRQQVKKIQQKFNESAIRLNKPSSINEFISCIPYSNILLDCDEQNDKNINLTYKTAMPERLYIACKDKINGEPSKEQCALFLQERRYINFDFMQLIELVNEASAYVYKVEAFERAEKNWLYFKKKILPTMIGLALLGVGSYVAYKIWSK